MGEMVGEMGHLTARLKAVADHSGCVHMNGAINECDEDGGDWSRHLTAGATVAAAGELVDFLQCWTCCRSEARFSLSSRAFVIRFWLGTRLMCVPSGEHAGWTLCTLGE